MRRAPLPVLLALLWEMPAAAEGWTCSVQEELSPTLSASMETSVAADGQRPTLSLFISWAARGRIAEQQMSWVAIPREATFLWKPDQLAFGIDSRRTDRRGYVRFENIFMPSLVRGEGMLSRLGNFRQTWVKIVEPYVLAQFWQRQPRRAELFDRRPRLLGSTDIRLPGSASVQALFTRMRAELERKAADAATHCRAIPDPPDEEQHAI